MGKLRKRIRKAKGNGSMEQYYSTCLGAAQGMYCESQCHRSGIDNYAMALVRQQYKSTYFVTYGK